MNEELFTKFYDALIGDEDSLLIGIRFKKCINREKYQLLLTLLDEIREEFTGSEMIPKKYAALFMPFYVAITSSLDFYSEQEQIEIEDIADKMMEKFDIILCN